MTSSRCFCANRDTWRIRSQQLTSQDVEQRLRAFLIRTVRRADADPRRNQQEQLAALSAQHPKPCRACLQDLKRRKSMVWKQGLSRSLPSFGRRIRYMRIPWRAGLVGGGLRESGPGAGNK